ncbi:MAG: ABC transporter permease [Bacillota bacterium]
MRSFATLLKQDLLLAYRNGFLVVVLVMVALIAPLIDFAIPKELKLGAEEYVLDLTEGKQITPYFVRQGIDSRLLLTSEEQLMSIMQQNKRAVSVVFRGSTDHPEVTVYHQGYEPPKAIRLLQPVGAEVWSQTAGAGAVTFHRVQNLRPEAGKVPFNKSLIPFFIATDVTVVGFYLVAVMVFQEKAERTLRAYRISPSGTWSYILSKILTNVILSVAYGALLLLSTMGFAAEYLGALLLCAAASFLITAAGLLVSVFFDSLSEFIFIAVLITMVLALPMASYFFPSFKLSFFPFVPSYPVMFGMRELLFPTGRSGYLLPMVLSLTGEGLLALLISYWAVDRRLMHEV